MKTHSVYAENLLDENGTRIPIYVSDADYRKIAYRGPGYRGTIRDVGAKIRFKVYGAECNIPDCWCAIVVERIKPVRSAKRSSRQVEPNPVTELAREVRRIVGEKAWNTVAKMTEKEWNDYQDQGGLK